MNRILSMVINFILKVSFEASGASQEALNLGLNSSKSLWIFLVKICEKAKVGKNKSNMFSKKRGAEFEQKIKQIQKFS